ncbi:MAG: zinc ribbon domain-containing protein [Candidatus Eremiobacteraeota bacterium]|nr:zinc ribbon domain-containing protein [Candidatus Eremiobacteraeota bacterium]
MSTRTFHGNVTTADLAQHLEATFTKNGLIARSRGDQDGTTVQISSSQGRESGGQTSLAITLQAVEDGVLVKMGEQSWLGIAASLGETALSVAKNPWSLIGRLDDLAADFDAATLEKQAWKAIEGFMRSRAASTQISDRLRRVQCPYCDFANPAGAGECSACGAPLGTEQPQSCLKCGFVNDARAVQCGQCGHGLGLGASAPSPMAGPPSSPPPLPPPVPVAAASAPSQAYSEPVEAVPQVSCRGCGAPHAKGTLFCSVCSRPLPRR